MDKRDGHGEFTRGTQKSHLGIKRGGALHDPQGDAGMERGWIGGGGEQQHSP